MKSTVVDDPNAADIRVYDERGIYCFLDGHADCSRIQVTSVVSWQSAHHRKFCMVRSAILAMSGGDRIAIAARAADTADSLAELEEEAFLLQFRQELQGEQEGQTENSQLQTVRKIIGYLKQKVPAHSEPVEEPRRRRARG